MIEMIDTHYRSKAFRDGGMVRLMDFAVRGIPRNFLPGEQYVDVDWARALYAPELARLDELKIHTRWFPSAIVGAGLISLVVWPQTIELWRRLARREVRRDGAGADLPCLLYERIERHLNDERLTRRFDFHMHLFQTALAVAHAWAYHDQEQQCFGQIPPGPDVPELIARVCKAKNEKSRATGFRPIRVLRDHWFEPQAPVLIHRADAKAAVGLAREAIELEGARPNTALIERAIDWFMDRSPDPELCHPATLAAAGVTIARDERSRELWEQVIARQGIRVPNQGRKPATDTAMVMQDCIVEANRSKDALESARYLYWRLLRAVGGWYESPEQRWVRLPIVYRSHVEESELWADSPVRFSVEVHFDGYQPEPQLQADPEAPRTGCRRRKQGSESTAKRLTTGLKAERWFQDNHHTLPQFDGVDLEDRRDKCEGFDFEGRLAEESKYIEVKALRAGKSAIRLTDQQWRVARLEGERYFLVVVRDIDTDQPRAEVIQNPAARLKAERRECRAPTVSWLIQMD